ncbi:Uncharacterized conserved protein YegP, UPF0339 family [Dehalogenimonas formicexedens]|uniref:Uncharacterized conserved protein YegP, UPF0339 family n=1 Tax=Dehalogenimonas formicexedens TaxID=1839801 RepID=A0A1P8F6T6_9CHLR|nr:Uncharacterized conserved protein YegP, UPF0339 family [Dehalogenimonas formicexedens]
MTGKFQVYKDKSGEYRFRLIAGNGRIIAVSEGYETEPSAMAGIEAVREYSSKANVWFLAGEVEKECESEGTYKMPENNSSDLDKLVASLDADEAEQAYTHSMELLIHEFRTLSERNTIFIAVQTILVGISGTLAYFISGDTLNPLLIFIVSGFGLAFIMINYYSGKNGSEQAKFWRDYMNALENRITLRGKGLPWHSLFTLLATDHKHRFVGKWLCGACLIKRNPYPFAWLFYPMLFLFGYASAIAVVIWNKFHWEWLIVLAGSVIGVCLVALKEWWQSDNR